jgi:hypothetical protein
MKPSSEVFMKLYKIRTKKRDHLTGRSWGDRRSGQERRGTYNFDYFNRGGMERRNPYERRHRRNDRRKKWVMTETLSSVPGTL